MKKLLFLMLFLPSMAYATNDFSDKTAWWKVEENGSATRVDDANAYDLTAWSDPARSSTNCPNDTDGGSYSCTFDGSADLIYRAMSNMDSNFPGDTDWTEQDFTVSFWLRTGANAGPPSPGGVYGIMGITTSNWALHAYNAWGFFEYNNSGTNEFRFWVDNQTTRYDVASTITPEANTWYRITGVYDHDTTSIYIYVTKEGGSVVSVGPVDGTCDSVGSENNFRLGYQGGYYGPFYLDDIVIANGEEWSTTDHTQAYNGYYGANFESTKEALSAAPTSAADLSTPVTESNISSDDNTYETLSVATGTLVGVFQEQETAESASEYITVTWIGKSTYATSSGTAYLRIWDDNADPDAWASLDDDSATGAGTEFVLNAEKLTNLTYYYDASYNVSADFYQTATNGDTISTDLFRIYTGIALVGEITMSAGGVYHGRGVGRGVSRGVYQ
jgi:hypothetical protein